MDTRGAARQRASAYTSARHAPPTLTPPPPASLPLPAQQITANETADALAATAEFAAWLEAAAKNQTEQPAHAEPLQLTRAMIEQRLFPVRALITRLARKPRPAPKVKPVSVNGTAANATRNATNGTAGDDEAAPRNATAGDEEEEDAAPADGAAPSAAPGAADDAVSEEEDASEL